MEDSIHHDSPGQEYQAWKRACDEHLTRPFPAWEASAIFSPGEIERNQGVSFAHLSNWEIVCQEILDTEFPPVYYQKGLEELQKRGKSEQEILEMRRCAWYTAGWYNYQMMVWDWTSLDESDMRRALELLNAGGQIRREEREDLEETIKRHA